MKKNTLWAMIKIIGWILLGVLATGLIIALYAASRFFGSGFF
jgi:flagellar biosynthesis protein FliQ